MSQPISVSVNVCCGQLPVREVRRHRRTLATWSSVLNTSELSIFAVALHIAFDNIFYSTFSV